MRTSYALLIPSLVGCMPFDPGKSCAVIQFNTLSTVAHSTDLLISYIIKIWHIIKVRYMHQNSAGIINLRKIIICDNNCSCRDI